MSKTILLTGATDGIGREAAKKFASLGHHVILHGRNADKLADAATEVGGTTTQVVADLSDLAQVKAMAAELRGKFKTIDVVMNNAGVLKLAKPVDAKGNDLRFIVNTVAPYLLAQELLDIIAKDGRIINLSSAAQAPVDLDALTSGRVLPDMEAYAQSKLAITMWSAAWGARLSDGPMVLSLNPGSLLATKMVKEGFGIAGNDISQGADILVATALDSAFDGATGLYFDNDAGRMGTLHPDARDAEKLAALEATIKATISAAL